MLRGRCPDHQCLQDIQNNGLRFSNHTTMPACCSDSVVTTKKCFYHAAAGLVVLRVGLVNILVVV